jgi:uncharacterized protein
MRWLDTNILIRYLTGDDAAKAAASLALIQRVELGNEEIQTCEAIICETVYILSSRALYRLSHTEIRDRLAPVINLRGLKLPNKRLYLRGLDIFAERRSLDFEDALSVAYMENEGITELYSYDTDFDRIPGINRVEP